MLSLRRELLWEGVTADSNECQAFVEHCLDRCSGEGLMFGASAVTHFPRQLVTRTHVNFGLTCQPTYPGSRSPNVERD